MKESEIKLLFDAGALRVCIIVPAAFGGGFNAVFARKGEIKPSISLETRPRKSGDEIEVRRFKTIDSACSLVKRQVGFKSFIVES